MPAFVNPNAYTVRLTGPDGKQIVVKGKQKITLSEYFNRYVSRGFLKPLIDNVQPPAQHKPPQAHIKLSPKNRELPQQGVHQVPARNKSKSATQARDIRKKQELIKRAKKISKSAVRPVGMKLVVGRQMNIDATRRLHDNLAKNSFPISNNIGVGILTHNRTLSLKRLIDSILRTTDINKTKIFISDDGSTDADKLIYLDELSRIPNLVVLKNGKNIGVAGNSNRLLRCLSRFKYGILLNDDVEVLQEGWDQFYVEAILRTGMHHFLYRQPGIYNADRGELIDNGKFHLRKIDKRPHGAVMAFTRKALVECGYFDERYGQYGMEHVDWSMKPAEFGLQAAGFYDVEGSDAYFKIYDEKSTVDRHALLKEARKVFRERAPRYRVGPTESSKLPDITYVIPFRNTDREDSIRTVVSNIRAQSFPVIHIIAVEQDTHTNIALDKLNPVTYLLAKSSGNKLFNKAMAFNYGVSKVISDRIVLHDADMLVQTDYTSMIYDMLHTYEACHLGGAVVYATRESTKTINNTGLIDVSAFCDRAVSYFEGGSLACYRSTYWRIGGFNEDFWGYGVEDCDFYARLSGSSKWRSDRKLDFLHLWHSRASGWNDHHVENKAIGAKLDKLSIADRIRLQREQLRKLGYGDFL